MVPVAALTAAHAGSLGVGFSGGGFLIPFFLGVLDVLQRQLGIIRPDMPMAGASSGCLVLITAKGAIPLDALRNETHRLGDVCRARSNCYGILQGEVVDTARRLVRQDVAEYFNRIGGAYVAITYPSPMGFQPAEQKLISHFESRDDLIEAGASSIYLPYYAGPRLTTSFRGQRVYDGGFAGPGQGFLPCPPNVTYCLRISAYPPGLSLMNITFDSMLQGGPASLLSSAAAAAGMAGSPAFQSHVAGLASAYESDGAAAALSELGQVTQLVRALRNVVTPGEGLADIWPGRRHKLPCSDGDWLGWSMTPAVSNDIDAIYNIGKAEALSWAQEAGFVAGGGKAAAAKEAGRGA